AEGNCNALWPRGQDGDPTIWSFDSYYHCVGCNSPSLDVQHKSTSKSEMQLQGKSSNEEIRKPGRISEENAVGPCGKITGNGELEGGNSSNHGKSHILHSEGERQELLCRGINSWKDRKNESREQRDIQHDRTSRKREKSVPWRVLHGKKTTRKHRVILYSLTVDQNGELMSLLSYDNRFDLSGNNLTLEVEMIENEPDRCRIAKSLDIEIQSADLQKDNIYRYYWILHNAKPVPWGVSLDGTVWELSDLDSPEECNSHPVSDKKRKLRTSCYCIYDTQFVLYVIKSISIWKATVLRSYSEKSRTDSGDRDKVEA
ncbi:20456_t:CDS:2, partial [Funneliformis geosporum]